MAAWTLAQAQEKLALWMAADDAIAQGQSYSIDSGGNRRQLTRADGDLIRRNIEFWRREVNRLQSGSGGSGPKIKHITPL